MSISLYIEELKQINKEHLGSECYGFRNKGVFCVDRLDRTIHFSAVENIEADMQSLVHVFSAEFAKASDLANLCQTFAKFYYAFIAIHPFPDANRRTAFTFLERRASDKGYCITGIEILQKVLLEGAVQTEMQKLMALFSRILQPTLTITGD